MMKKKKYFLGLISDMVSDLFFYDRKNDEELSEEDMNELIENKQITKEEIIKTFTEALNEVEGL